jgi:hypothetical protein
VGIQDVTFRNRPHDEPFFIDLGEVEVFFSGFAPAGGHVRATADRDVQEATGVRLGWRAMEVIGAQAFWMVYDEDGPASADESLQLAVLNGRPMDHLAAWLMAVRVAGPAPERARLWSFGTGVDAYVGGSKTLELFGEAWLQRGELVDGPKDVRKRAFGGVAGARVVGLLADGLWAEAAVSSRSGNERAGDSTDEAFQSYENENRFLILQSAEFGLDVDTNVRLARAAAGYGPFEVGGRPLRLQADVGWFEADEPVRDAAGGLLTRGKEDRWGVETDVGASWSYGEALLFWAKGAWLANSSILEDLTSERRDEAWLLVAGADLRF